MPHPVHRIDSFAVPEPARAEFVARVRETHAILRTCEGFVRDLIVTKCGGAGQFDVVTLVEWSDAAAMEAARTTVAAAHRARDFAPAEFMARLGVEADIGVYR